MNKLDRFRFGNLHKRRIFFVVVLVASVFAVSMVLLAFLGVFGSRSELPRLRISAEQASGTTEGVGINIIDMPDTNLIDDPFFDHADRCFSAPVAQAYGNYIYFEPEYSSLFQDAPNGEVNILSIDSDGSMGLRYSGNSVGVDSTRFAVPVNVNDDQALWVNDPVIKSVENNGDFYILTVSGSVISNATVSPCVESIEGTVTDICSEGIYVYALTTGGDVYVSNDTAAFVYLGSCGSSVDSQPLYISSVNGNIIVFFSDGTLKTLSPSGFTTTGNILADFVSTGDGFVGIVEGRNIYISRNGLFMSELTEAEEYLDENDHIIDVEASSDKLCILTSYGKLITVFNSEGFSDIAVCDISSIEPVSICPADGDGVLAVSSDKQACYVSCTSGSTDSLGITNIAIEDIMRFGDSEFVIKSGNNLYISSLMTALEVDTPIAEESILNGDICQFAYTSADIGSWDTCGNSQLISSPEGVSLHGFDEGVHAMSKVLDGTPAELFEKNLFYRIEINMSSSTDGMLADVWLEGETFGSQGLHIDNLSDKIMTYSYVFAITEDMLSDESLRFNIAFNGEGSVNISSVYVGLDRYDINSIQTEFRDDVVYCSPSALRFGYIVPGSDGFCSDTYYGLSAVSLENSMLLARDSGADPWVVLGSAISQDDVDDFLGYMCGSVSNEYGKRRIDNGTALPWNRQFDTIYVEISDTDGVFPSDLQRGSYVSYVIRLFEKSSFYIEIKDRIVFVDGMNYEGGIMLSSADRHASAMRLSPDIVGADTEVSFASVAGAALENARYESPRSASRGGTDGGEFISSVSIDMEGNNLYSGADIVSFVLNAESTFSDLVMFDSDIDLQGIIPTLRPLIDGTIMYCETLDPVDSNSGYSAEVFNSSCDTLLIDGNENIYVIVSNHSDSLQQFMTQSEVYDTSVGVYRRYASDGRLLLERNLNHLGRRLVLQPGEYMVIEIPK